MCAKKNIRTEKEILEPKKKYQNRKRNIEPKKKSSPYLDGRRLDQSSGENERAPAPQQTVAKVDILEAGALAEGLGHPLGAHRPQRVVVQVEGAQARAAGARVRDELDGVGPDAVLRQLDLLEGAEQLEGGGDGLAALVLQPVAPAHKHLDEGAIFE